MTSSLLPAFLIDAWQFDHTKATGITGPLQWQQNSWFHCQRDEPGLHHWLHEIGLTKGLTNALLAEDTRPRFQQFGDDCFLLILRGVNLNQGEEPDDMLSLRILFYDNSIITLRKRPFRAISTIRQDLANGEGPSSLSQLLLDIIEQMNFRISEVLEKSERLMDELQEDIERLTILQQRQLTQMHRQLLKLNRFLKPQTFALSELTNSKVPLLRSDEDQLLISNLRDTSYRIIENIEAYIDQVWMLREHSQQASADLMNRNTYRLSVVAGIFLPLGFLTGLLGVNVGGIPGTDSPWAFPLFCAALGVLGVVEFMIFRRFRYW